ncbi:MAG: DUF1736 domain-containing protein [Planctomycetes bacterium]|nr:DUF1736 domain-containing protein [Planctomycetota bacterium]
MSTADRPRAGALLFVVLTIAALLCFANITKHEELVYDGYFLVELNDTYKQVDEQRSEHGVFAALTKLTQVFGEEFWEATNRARPQILRVEGQALYRPLMMYTLGVARLMSDTRDTKTGKGLHDPLPFNAMNLGFHVGCTWLVALLALHLSRRRSIAWLAGLLFAVHPIHSEAVSYTAGLGETQATFFALVSLYAYVRTCNAVRTSVPGLIVTILAFAASLFTKESGAITLVLLLLVDFARGNDAPRAGVRLLVLGAMLGIVAANIAIRLQVTGALAPDSHVISRLDNPLVKESFAARLATGPMLYVKAVLLFLWPASLSADYSFNQLPIARSLAEPGAFVSFLLCALMTVAGFIALKRRAALGFGLLAFLFAFGPVSNIPVPIGTIFGERLLYLPSVGLCIALAVVFDQIGRALGARNEALRAATRGVFIVLVVVAGIRTSNRNAFYSSNEVLYSNMPETAPESSRGYFQRAEYERGRPKKERNLNIAIADYKESIRIWPEFLYAYHQLAIATAENGDVKGGLAQLDLLKAMIGPGESVRYLRNMIELTKAQISQIATPGDGRSREEIQKLFEDQIRLAPDDIGPYLALIPLYLDQNEVQKAKDLLANSPLPTKDGLRHTASQLQIAGREQRIDDVRGLLATLQQELTKENAADAGDVRGLVTFYSAVLGRVDGLAARASGDLAKSQQLLSDALTGLDQYVEKNEGDWQGYFFRGELKHMALEQYDEALLDYQEALKLNGTYTMLYLRIHQVINLLRRFDPNTLRLSEECEKLMPKDAGLKMMRAQFLSAIGRHEEAAAKVKEAIQMGLSGSIAYAMVSSELTLAGKADEAMNVLTEILKTRKDPLLIDAVGSVLLETNDPKGALARYEEALALAQSSPEWRGSISELEFKIAKTRILIPGQEAEGVKTLTAIAELVPPAGLSAIEQRSADQRRAFAMRQLARARLNVEALKDPAAAVTLLEQSVQLARGAKIDKPNLRDLLVDLADAYAANGRLQDARKSLDDAERAAGANQDIELRRSKWQ